MFIGTMGIFMTCYLAFTRIAPVIAIAEVKAILKTMGDQYLGENAHAHDTHSPATVEAAH